MLRDAFRPNSLWKHAFSGLCWMLQDANLVPGAGLEPARRSYPARDFKSLVSTNFTTRADVGPAYCA